MTASESRLKRGDAASSPYIAPLSAKEQLRLPQAGEIRILGVQPSIRGKLGWKEYLPQATR
jgi:hypothetical protein